MWLEPEDARWRRLLDDLETHHAGAKDLNGRPWAEHFRRVAMRLCLRKPQPGRDQLEAALLHDALMTGGGGRERMERLGLSEAAMEIVRVTTPPPNADYYRDFRAVTAEDDAGYLTYIRGLVASGNIAAVEMKLVDVCDTIDQMRVRRDPAIIAQVPNRYEPSRSLLEEGLDRLLGAAEA
jgi:ethanolamine utilization microcompartment shell protein EutS